MPIDTLIGQQINVQFQPILEEQQRINQINNLFSDVTYKSKSNKIITISSEIYGIEFDVLVDEKFYIKTEEQKIQESRILYQTARGSLVNNSPGIYNTFNSDTENLI
jgi:hypothetical protein